MRRLVSKRPAPGTVLALIALVVALGGTAIAAHSAHKLNGHHIKKLSLPGNRLTKHSVGDNRLKRNTLSGSAINEETLGVVPHAALADVARVANTATVANSATVADGPAVFAHVRDDGTLDAANSRGVTQANVVREDVGQYCFRGLAFPVKGVSGVVEGLDSTLGDAMRITIPDDDIACANGGQVGVEIGDDGTFDDAGFYIAFYN